MLNVSALRYSANVPPILSKVASEVEGLPGDLPLQRQPVRWNLSYQLRIEFFAGGSFWNCVRNSRCTVKTDILTWNCKTQNAFSSPLAAILHLVSLLPSGCNWSNLAGSKFKISFKSFWKTLCVCVCVCVCVYFFWSETALVDTFATVCLFRSTLYPPHAFILGMKRRWDSCLKTQ